MALISRFADEHVFSVDALGLRPLWQLETADAFFFSSEPGVVAVSAHDRPSPSRSPRARRCRGGRSLQVARPRCTTTAQLQHICAARWRERTGSAEGDLGFAGAILTGGPLAGAEIPGYTSAGPSEPVKVEDRVLGGFGWQREDMKLVQQMAATGQEPIGSLGYDGPLAASRRSARTWPTTSRSRWRW